LPGRQRVAAKRPWAHYWQGLVRSAGPRAAQSGQALDSSARDGKQERLAQNYSRWWCFEEHTPVEMSWWQEPGTGANDRPQAAGLDSVEPRESRYYSKREARGLR
jgi:hypothetical protein